MSPLNQTSSSIPHLCWYKAQLVWDKVTRIEIVTLGTLGLWLVILLLINRPLSTEITDLKRRLQHAQVTQAKAATSQLIIKSAVPLPLEESLPEAFIKFLPQVSKQKEQLILFHQLADKSGLSLSNIQYKNEVIKTIPIQQLLLQLKLEGKESALRLFLHTILNNIPNLGINNITLEKAANQQESANISLAISLYYHQ